MRTDTAIDRLTQIAVEAQCLQPIRKAMLDQILIKSLSSAKGFPMLLAVIAYVIKRQKAQFALSAARALHSVMLKDLPFGSYVFLPTVFSQSLCIASNVRGVHFFPPSTLFLAKILRAKASTLTANLASLKPQISAFSTAPTKASFCMRPLALLVLGVLSFSIALFYYRVTLPCRPSISDVGSAIATGLQSLSRRALAALSAQSFGQKLSTCPSHAPGASVHYHATLYRQVDYAGAPI